jgi:hypothetical protein
MLLALTTASTHCKALAGSVLSRGTSVTTSKLLQQCCEGASVAGRLAADVAGQGNLHLALRLARQRFAQVRDGVVRVRHGACDMNGHLYASSCLCEARCSLFLCH